MPTQSRDTNDADAPLATALLESSRGVANARHVPSRRCCTFRFDQFTLDPRTRQLLCAKREVHLSPKAFDLLLTLIDNRSRAMSRAELQKGLWPSTFVLDTNLASLIAEIRRGLGDSADDPRYVRTMHRYGYWFIGAVQETDGGEVAVKPAVRYWLVWQTKQVPLAEGINVIGRAPDAAVWIDASGVSRNHARITVAGEDATVEDLGSKNGTFVRGERIGSAHRLADGDQIRLGSVVITFRVPAPVGSTDTVHSR